MRRLAPLALLLALAGCTSDRALVSASTASHHWYFGQWLHECCARTGLAPDGEKVCEAKIDPLPAGCAGLAKAVDEQIRVQELADDSSQRGPLPKAARKALKDSGTATAKAEAAVAHE